MQGQIRELTPDVRDLVPRYGPYPIANLYDTATQSPRDRYARSDGRLALEDVGDWYPKWSLVGAFWHFDFIC
jgi:hypothetical protein